MSICIDDPICLAFASHSTLWTVGLSLAGIWVALYPLSWLGAWVWSWVDETKMPHNNPILSFIARRFGYYTDPEDLYWDYRHKNKPNIDDGVRFFLVPLLILLASPPFIIFYELTFFVVSGIVVAHLARFARRHRKMFDEHVADKGVHK